MHDEDSKKLLNSLNIKLDKLMAKTQEQFDALMGRLNVITNDIAADYKKLLDEIKANADNTVSPESIAAAEANIAKLEALGASVENPVPPPVEPPVE